MIEQKRHVIYIVMDHVDVDFKFYIATLFHLLHVCE